jgi:cobalt-zinc-cadmium efflux system outer membrane protein
MDRSPKMHVAALALAAGLTLDYAGAAARAAPGAPAAPAPAADERGDEAALAREARLGPILRLARSRNPDLLEARERILAARARAGAAGRLPDPELKYEQWEVPLRTPLSLNRAGMLMLGLRQTFPALGTRAARGRIADEEAAALDDGERARARDLTAQVRRAYGQYWRAEHEYRVHQEHVGLLARVVELSRGHYQAGHGSQQDLLRLTVELSQLHTDVANLEQERQSSRALLNVLMGRAPDAPLGPPPEDAIALSPAPSESPSDGKSDAPSDGTSADLDTSRPEVASATRAVRRGEAALDLAQRSARWPTLMVGADYWYMPLEAMPHAYGAMVSINLPWLNARHREEVAEAEHALAGDRRALEAQRNVARFELRDAAARVDAALQAVRIIDDDLLPLARRSFESAQAAYEAGQGSALALLDALRSYLQVRLERSRALARLDASRADYDRAAGVAVREGGAS